MKYVFLLPLVVLISACVNKGKNSQLEEEVSPASFEEYLALFPKQELPFSIEAPQVVFRKKDQFIPKKYTGFLKKKNEGQTDLSVLDYSYQPIANLPLGDGQFYTLLVAAFASSPGGEDFNQVRINLITYYKTGQIIDSRVFAYCCYDLLSGSIDDDGAISINRYQVSWDKKNPPGYENKKGRREKLLMVNFYKIRKNGEIKWRRNLDLR